MVYWLKIKKRIILKRKHTWRHWLDGTFDCVLRQPQVSSHPDDEQETDRSSKFKQQNILRKKRTRGKALSTIRMQINHQHCPMVGLDAIEWNLPTCCFFWKEEIYSEVKGNGIYTREDGNWFVTRPDQRTNCWQLSFSTSAQVQTYLHHRMKTKLSRLVMILLFSHGGMDSLKVIE